jgi:hypothetical protein
VLCVLGLSTKGLYPTTYIHGPRRANVAAFPQRGGVSGCLLVAQKVFTDVPSKQAIFSGGELHPARTHVATKSRCAPRLRPGLRIPLLAPRARERGMYLYGTCFSTAASERSSATNGIKVDKPLKNAKVCIHTRMEN